MVFGYQSTRHPFHQLRNEVDRLLTGFLALRPTASYPPSSAISLPSTSGSSRTR